MKISGVSPDGRLVEAIEIPKNRFYIGVQFHPEFKSRPNHAHPLFKEFIKAALERNYYESGYKQKCIDNLKKISYKIKMNILDSFHQTKREQSIIEKKDIDMKYEEFRDSVLGKKEKKIIEEIEKM
jgi:hypothetical protein